MKTGFIMTTKQKIEHAFALIEILCVYACGFVRRGGGGGGILLNYARKLTFTPVGYKYCLGSI